MMRISSFGLLALFVLSGCGGDGSSSPSQSQVLPKVASPVAECLGHSPYAHGIEGTGRKLQGVVTAVTDSTVTVSTIVFDASNADVFVNGVCATLADVHPGATATVYGDFTDTTHTGTAFAIYADETVVGGINSIDISAGTLSVNGQEIVVSSATVFGDDILPAQLSTLMQNDMIAVSGSLRQDGTLVATHIHRWPAAAYDSVAGVVASIDANHGLLQVGGVRVLYTYSVLVGFSDGAIHTGDYVRVLGPPLGVIPGYEGATGIDAYAIQRAVVPTPDPSKDIVLAGAVSNARSSDDFDVMGQPVKMNSSTRFDFTGHLDVRTWAPNGYFVTVFGSLDPSGYVVADLVVPQQGSTVLLTGPITAIDRQTRTVDVVGIPVQLSGAYSYLEREGLTVKFDALNVGDQLRVEGSPLDTGVVDTLIARQNTPSAAVSLKGWGWDLGSSQRPIIVGVDGVQVDTTNAFSPSAADVFWEHCIRGGCSKKVTQVDGTWTGDHIDARKVNWEYTGG